MVQLGKRYNGLQRKGVGAMTMALATLAAQAKTRKRFDGSRKSWRVRVFEGLELPEFQPKLFERFERGELTREEYDIRRLRGHIGGELRKLKAKGMLPKEKFEEAKTWILRVATCSEAWGSGVFNEGLRFPPAPGVNPHASAMIACRVCTTFHPPFYVGSTGRCATCGVNRNTRFVIKFGMVVRASPGDNPAEAIVLPRATPLPSSRAISRVHEHHLADRQQFRDEGERRRRYDEEKPRKRPERLDGRKCDRCPAIAGDDCRYCRRCEREVRAAMNDDGYFEPLPPAPTYENRV